MFFIFYKIFLNQLFGTVLCFCVLVAKKDTATKAFSFYVNPEKRKIYPIHPHYGSEFLTLISFP